VRIKFIRYKLRKLLQYLRLLFYLFTLIFLKLLAPFVYLVQIRKYAIYNIIFLIKITSKL